MCKLLAAVWLPAPAQEIPGAGDLCGSACGGKSAGM